MISKTLEADIRVKLKERRIRYEDSLAKEKERILSSLIALGVDKVFLFGSYARGDKNPQDLDFIVIWDTHSDYLSRTEALYKHVSPKVAVDMLVYSPGEFQEIKERSFMKNILNDAVTLYAKKE